LNTYAYIYISAITPAYRRSF